MALLFAATKTRPVFWDFTTGLKVLWYVLAVFSVLVFALRRLATGRGASAMATAVRGRRSHGASSPDGSPPARAWCSHTARSSGATTRPAGRTA